MEGFRDEGGLFGIAGHQGAAHLAHLGLQALQHRGVHGAGLIVSDGHLLVAHHGGGLVPEAFVGPTAASLPGGHAIGQVHHASLEDGGVAGARAGQVVADRPLLMRYHGGQVGVAMIGRFTNGGSLRRELKEGGALFATVSDAELLLHRVARSLQKTFVNRLVDALLGVQGAFAALVLTEDRLVAVRDPYGFRPLVMGRLDGATIFASEDAAIRVLGGEVVRELVPGELVVVDAGGVRSVTPFPPRPRASCLHEFAALAGEDAAVFGRPAYTVRLAMGEQLGREQPCGSGDVVLGLPDAALPLAIGYARVAKLPFRTGLVRGGVDGPGEAAQQGPRLRAVPSVVAGQRVVLVAGALVTGDASRRVVQLLRRAGATEVHLRIGTPPVKAGCPYGVLSPTVDELVHSSHTDVSEVARYLDSESVGFLSFEGLRGAVEAEGQPQGWCGACFGGEYPAPPEERDDQLGLFDSA